MYYIICDGQVVDSSDGRPTREKLQQWANDLNAEAYVIRWEHAGMTATPDDDAATDEGDIPGGFDFADDVNYLSDY